MSYWKHDETYYQKVIYGVCCCTKRRQRQSKKEDKREWICRVDSRSDRLANEAVLNSLRDERLMIACNVA